MASSGVIGGIGEVLLCLFFTKIIGLLNSQIAHITYTTTQKSPDLIIESIASKNLAQLFDSKLPLSNQTIDSKVSTLAKNIYNELQSKPWSDHFPIECKTSKNGQKSLNDGFGQLLEYWCKVPSMNGYGIISRIQLEEPTKIHLTLLLPNPKRVLPSPEIVKNEIIANNKKKKEDKETLSEIIERNFGGVLIEAGE